jgi:hypothetical protein
MTVLNFMLKAYFSLLFFLIIRYPVPLIFKNLFLVPKFIFQSFFG